MGNLHADLRALAAEIEDPRNPRAGIQRRRIWADRILRILAAHSAAPSETATQAVERVEYAVEWMSNGPHPTRWVGQWSTFDALEDARRLAGYSHVHYPKILRRVTTATPWEQVEGAQS